MKKYILFIFLIGLSLSASGKNILIFGPRFAAGAPNEQTLAVAAGHTVTVVTAAQWAAMTTAQFAAYDAIIIPDDVCASAGAGNGDANLTVLNTNKSTWSPVVTGRVVLIGGDIFLHREGKYQQLTTNAINFVANGSGTGLFFITSCTYFNNYSSVPINFLSNVLPVNSIGSNCPSVHVITAPSHPVMSGITAADLGSDCNSHNQFGGFGASVTSLATAGGNPYIIAAEFCTSPTFTSCPGNISANTAATSCNAVVTYTATASGSNPIAYSYTFSGATTASGAGTGTGSTFNMGVTNVSVTASNTCGSAPCSFTVTVTDNVPPAITCPANATVDCQGSQDPSATGTATATDNCTPVSGINITHSDGAIVAGNCAGNYSFTRTWTATDAKSNASTCTQTINVQDVAAPALTGTPYSGGSGTNACMANAETAASFSPAAAVQGYTDNCSGPATATLTNTSVTGTDCNWTVTYTYSVSDACGNTLPGQSYSNTGGDNTPPTAVCKPATVTLSNGSASITPGSVFDNSSSDNCGQVTPVSVTPSSFSCADAGKNVSVTLTVKDGCNNTSSCSTTVFVVGAVPSCTITSTPTSGSYSDGNPQHIYYGYGDGKTKLTVNPVGGSSFTYQWSGSGLSCTTCADPVFTATGGGNYTFTVIVKNEYGCTTTCSITICVIDIRVPGENGKVYICHVPSGNPANAQTLSVGTGAVSSHLTNHGGDKLGMCGQTCAPGARMAQGSGYVIGEEVKVYPNPNNGTFTVELPYFEDKALISVTDVAGKTVQSRLVSDGDGHRLSFNLNNAARGVYFVEVRYGDQRFRTKLVIQ